MRHETKVKVDKDAGTITFGEGDASQTLSLEDMEEDIANQMSASELFTGEVEAKVTGDPKQDRLNRILSYLKSIKWGDAGDEVTETGGQK